MSFAARMVVAICGLALSLALAACGGGGRAAAPAPGNGPGAAADTTSPDISSITGVSEGSALSGSVVITVLASDNVGVVKLAVQINGLEAAAAASGLLNFAWDTLTQPDGAYTLTFIAQDAAGNLAQRTLHVKVNNTDPSPGGDLGPDTVPPTFVSVVGVKDGDSLAGTVSIRATAADNVAVTLLTLSIDNVQVTQFPGATLSFDWNTANFSDAAHQLIFNARDTAGNWTQLFVNVTVDQASTPGGDAADPGAGDPPDLPAPPADLPPDPTDHTPPANIVLFGLEPGQTVWGKVNFTVVATDEKAVWWMEAVAGPKRVGLTLDSNYMNVEWDTRTAGDGPMNLAIKVYDKGNNSATALVPVTINNSVDHAPPFFLPHFPNAINATGLYTFKFDVDDDRAIDSVAVQIEGHEVFRVQGQRHIEFPWNTLDYPDGMYLLSVIVTDTAGKQAKASLFGTVHNSTAAYTVSGRITMPNGQDPLPGAIVQIPRRSETDAPNYGSPPHFDQFPLRDLYNPDDQQYLETDADGRFAIPGVPPGTRHVLVQPSRVAGQPHLIDLQLNITGDYTLSAAEGKIPSIAAGQIAVVTGDREGTQNLLAKMGFGQVDASGALIHGTEQFVLIDGNDTLSDSLYLNLPDLLAPGSSLDGITQLYLCAGDHYTAQFASHPEWIARLKEWCGDGLAGILPQRYLYCGGDTAPLLHQFVPDVFDEFEPHQPLPDVGLRVYYGPVQQGQDPLGVQWLEARGFDMAKQQTIPWSLEDGWFGLKGSHTGYGDVAQAVATPLSGNPQYFALLRTGVSRHVGRIRATFNNLTVPAAPSTQWSLQERVVELLLMGDILKRNR